jgi:hypothetical protein
MESTQKVGRLIGKMATAGADKGHLIAIDVPPLETNIAMFAF